MSAAVAANPRTVVLVTSADIGPLLVAARTGKCWSQARAAYEAGLHPSMVTMCERGTRIPSTPKLIAMLDALGYDLVAVRRGA